MDPLIREERTADSAAVWRVHEAAFGQPAEADLVDALRDAGFGRVSLVAEADGMVVGHILFSQLDVPETDTSVDAVGLAPVAVLPDFQGRGIGASLVREGLRQCGDRGHTAVFVLGEPAYYQRFGFSAELAGSFASPYACDAWMAVELIPNSLAGKSGRVQHPAPFGGLDE